jgi:excisionase family DNA binding protein
MERLSTNEIAELTGVHSNTIRRYADRGIIESKRDFRGWRFYPEPMKTVKKIKALLEGDLKLEGHESKQSSN